MPTPRQLPSAPPLLIGRDHELGELEELAARTATAFAAASGAGIGTDVGGGVGPARGGGVGAALSGPIVLAGPAGVGKAALALAWLRLDAVLSRYPDGQLYGDLRTIGDPVQPQAVLHGFLTALGVPPQSVPPDLAGCAALFRSATAGRRIAVMLHGAMSAAQVRPLIPGGDGCLTVITSTWRLGALGRYGARWLEVPPLVEDAAVQLLAELAGVERVAAEMEAAREVTRLCGGLPLAVSMVGYRLVSNPHQRLGRLAEGLKDERRRLDRLTEEGGGVRAIIDACYRELSEDPARLYRVLGALPLNRFSVAAAAAGLSTPSPPDLDDVRDLLQTLVDAHLLQQTAEDRYHFHELVRLHAREVSRAAAYAQEHSAAVVQLERWYLATAASAATTVRPYRRDKSAQVDGLNTPPVAFDGLHAALDWLDAEAPNLLAVARHAAEQQRPEIALRITGQMWALFANRKHYRIWQEFDLLGLRCARELGDHGAEARMLRRLGLLAMDLGRYDEAAGHLTAAAALYERLADRHRLATVVNSLGVVCLRRGEPQAAIEQLSRALAVHRELGDQRQCGLVLIDLGDALIEAGRADEAAERLQRADELLQGSADLYSVAHLRMLLGRACGLLGRDPAKAESDLDAALATMTALGSAFGQIEALGYRAELAERAEAAEAAQSYYERAAELLFRLGTPGSAWLGRRISSLSPLAGQVLARGPSGRP